MIQNLEHKSLQLSLNSFDEVKGVFTGYASVFNEVDRVNDTIDPKAYDLALEEFKSGNPVPINFEHNKKIVLAGNLSSMEVDAKGLLVSWQFSEEAKSAYPDIWQWAVSKAKSGNLFMSIGFVVLKSMLADKRQILKKKFREPDTIYSMKLDHIAATDNPVDTKAQILEVKGLRTPKYPIHLSESWDGDAAEKRWREYTKSTDAPSSQYKNGFLYIEDGREELFGSYHFLVTDIIDGEPMVNELAVITAYRYLKGARNGVKILDAEQKSAALEIISKLYEKINRVRKQEGMSELPAVEMKSDINYNEMIPEIDGIVSAKRFLKNHQGQLSKTNIENFVDHVSNIFSKAGEVKAIKELETREKSQCSEPTSVPEVKQKPDFLNEVGLLLIKK